MEEKVTTRFVRGLEKIFSMGIKVTNSSQAKMATTRFMGSQAGTYFEVDLAMTFCAAD